MNKRFLLLSGLIVLALATRLLPHPPNFAPITAIALFGGVYFERKWMAFLVPFVAMFLSDVLIGFHNTMHYVYISFALMVGLGLWLRSSFSYAKLIAGTLTGSITFFLITNFGVWFGSTFYTQDLSGLITCFTAAIPFFQNTVLGDVVYTASLFGTFALAQKRISGLATA